jgi:hypothetical protein
MITSVLGLVIMAIGVAAATIRNAILRGQEQASSERRILADALRAVAEHQRVQRTETPGEVRLLPAERIGPPPA